MQAVSASTAADGEPAAKRAKTSADGGTTHVIREDLLSSSSRGRLRQEHDTSGPYTHVVLKDLCEPDLLRAVRDEVIHNITATYKETDLFKVFQTGKQRGECSQQQQQLCLPHSLVCTTITAF
jgi:hypothetical protein